METVKTPWDGVALVCRKCSRKLDGGFGPKGKQKLEKALRTELKEQGRRRALRVVPVDCLGLCPKRAVTVVFSATPGFATVVPEGADLKTVLATSVPS